MQQIQRNALLIILAALVVFAGQSRSTGAADSAGSGEARSLFNGQDLSGWEGQEGIWSVEDGAITGRSIADKPLKQNTFLVWKDGKVGDFELRLKFRITGGNSGIQYRSKDLGEHAISGYQADIVHEGPYSGILYEEKGRGILANRGQKVVIPAGKKPKVVGSLGDAKELGGAVKPGEWNEYLITARGNHLVHAINGVKMIDAVDEDTDKGAAEGVLALQVHTGPPMTVQFKDIELRALPAEPKPTAR